MWCFLPRRSPEETLLLPQQKWSVSRFLKGEASLPLELSGRVGVETAKGVWSSPTTPGEEGSRRSGAEELNQERHMLDDRWFQNRPRTDPCQTQHGEMHDTLSSCLGEWWHTPQTLEVRVSLESRDDTPKWVITKMWAQATVLWAQATVLKWH